MTQITDIDYLIRRDACRLAAQAFRMTDAETSYTPLLWSMTVFFEEYLRHGSAHTLADFGPKEPVALREAGEVVL